MSSSVKIAIKDTILTQGVVTLENIETNAFNQAFCTAAHAQGIYHKENKEYYNVLFKQVKACLKRTLRSRAQAAEKNEEALFSFPFSPADWLADVSKSWRRADIAIALAGGSFD